MSFNLWVAALCAAGAVFVALGLSSLWRAWHGIRERAYPRAILFAVLATVAFALAALTALALLISLASEHP